MIVHLQIHRWAVQERVAVRLIEVRETMLKAAMDVWKQATTAKDQAERAGLADRDPVEWGRLHTDMLDARSRFYDLVATFTGRRLH